MEKEKNRLMISSIIMILYMFINLGESIRKNDFITDNLGKNIFNIVLLLIMIFGSIYFLYLSKKKIEIKNHKFLILIVSILFFVINILSGVLGFTVYNNLKEKKEIPKLEDVKGYNKYICLVSLIICLFLLFFVSKKVNSVIGSVLIYLPILLIMVITYRKRLVRDFKVFKENFESYNSLVLKTWGISLLVTIVLNITIRYITNIDNATNQETLNFMFEKMPLYIAFLSMIYAPLAEELMFRATFKEFIKNKYLFIFISGFIFGLIHVIDDFKAFYELLYILVYSSLGWFLAYLYQKTNNIFSNIYFHFLQNTLSVIAMILLMFSK